MKKILAALWISIFLFSCSSTEDDNEPNGEVYHKITLDVPISGSSELIFGNNNASGSVFRNGQNFTTDKYLHGANENLSFQIITWSVLDCRSITIETFFKNKSIDIRTFRMGSLEPNASSPTLCKDGDQQIVNLITPK